MSTYFGEFLAQTHKRATDGLGFRGKKEGGQEQSENECNRVNQVERSNCIILSNI